MARRRVGFLTTGWWPELGGVQSLTRELAAALGARGQRVFALAIEREAGAHADAFREELVEGVQLRRVALTPADQRSLGDLSRAARLEEQVASWCADAGLDVVHVHSLDPWGLGVPVRLQELGVPLVWTWHDYWALCPRGQLWHVEGRACERARPAECASCVGRSWPELGGLESAQELLEQRLELARRAFESCDRVHTPSAASRAVMARHGLDETVIELRPNAVASARSVARIEAPAQVRVGLLGSVQPSKGVLELANWIVELGEPFRLRVHGPRPAYHGDRSYVRALEDLAAREPRIELRGAYDPDELPELFADLDLVAVPSLWEEVFGLVAREARAAGLPVFVSDRGGLTDGAFHVLPAGDGVAWKGALGRFAEDEAWRRELLALPAPGPGVEQLAEQLLAEYEAVIGG